MNESSQNNEGIGFTFDDSVMFEYMDDNDVDFSGVAMAIKHLVETNNSYPDDIVRYSYEVLKKTMTHFKIKGRSSYTTKEVMAEAIYVYLKYTIKGKTPHPDFNVMGKSFKEVMELLPDTTDEYNEFWDRYLGRK